MLKTSDIMTRNPVCCEPDTGLEVVAKMMCDNDCGELPVVESFSHPRPLGVITDRDIVCRAVAEGKEPLKLAAKDCMTSPSITVTPDTSLEEACHLLERHQIRRVPVVDDAGLVCGMLSQADIALKAGDDKIGEVVREISVH